MPVFQGVFGMGYSKRRALPYVVKLKAFSQNLLMKHVKIRQKSVLKAEILIKT